jgi:hypothetical protein
MGEQCGSWCPRCGKRRASLSPASAAYGAAIAARRAVLRAPRVLRASLPPAQPLDGVALAQVNVENPLFLEFQGVLPDRGLLSAQGRGRSKAASVAAGHYYVAGPKVGQVFMACTHEAFRHYTVNPMWIANNVQSGKFSVADARKQFVLCGKNLAHNLANLSLQEREMASIALQDRKDHVWAELRRLVRPSKTYPDVDRWLWKQTHIRFRQPFLVLEGPSCLGKTQFAMSLVAPGKGLEVNCCACPEPDLRSFRSMTHELILFDEASPELVLRQHKLFQAPAVDVTLGASTTNCHAYTVWVHSVKMVVASNTWNTDADVCKPLDRAWLRENSVVLTVREPMWLA